MRRPAPTPATVIAPAPPTPAPPTPAPPQAAPTTPCDIAGAEAERRHDIPDGLLRAIGRAESGRRDPATGRFAPWPWAINAEGRGRLFDTQAEALAGARALQATGIASIDVGCYQVNLVHHPAAFATLEDGFDPGRNADYAARFLAALRAKTGAWESAVAAYHSATPERGNPYRDRVLAFWGSPGTSLPAAGPAPIPAAAPTPLVVRVVNWTPPSGGMKIWTPSAPGHGAAVINMGRPTRF